MLCGRHQLVPTNQSTSEPKLQLVKQDLCLCPLAFQAEASHIMLMIVRDRTKAAKHLGTTCTSSHAASYALCSPCLVNQCDRYCSIYAVATASWRLLYPACNKNNVNMCAAMNTMWICVPHLAFDEDSSSESRSGIFLDVMHLQCWIYCDAAAAATIHSLDSGTEKGAVCYRDEVLCKMNWHV